MPSSSASLLSMCKRSPRRGKHDGIVVHRDEFDHVNREERRLSFAVVNVKEFARPRESHVLTKSKGFMELIPLPRRFNRGRANCVALPVPRAIHERQLTWVEVHIRNVPNLFLLRVILETRILRPALQHNTDAGRHEQIKGTTLPRKESFQGCQEPCFRMSFASFPLPITSTHPQTNNCLEWVPWRHAVSVDNVYVR